VTNLINMFRTRMNVRGVPLPRRLLVIEDDAELARLVERVVGNLETGWTVEIASTAEEARSLLASGHYAFVLVDYFLDQGQLGTDLLELIRSTQSTTGLAMMSSLELMKFIEVTSHERDLQILPKPFSPHQLAAFMLDVLPGDSPRTHNREVGRAAY